MAEAETIWDVNKRRAVMKIPVTSLCVQAGIARQTYDDAMNARKEAKPATIARLNMALQRFKLSYAGDSGPLSVHAAYKGALVLAAMMLKADPKPVLSSDPARKATADPAWRAGARVRRLAYMITNLLQGFRISDVARAAGVTKQAVSIAIKEGLDDEDDEELQRAFRQLEEIFAS